MALLKRKNTSDGPEVVKRSRLEAGGDSPRTAEQHSAGPTRQITAPQPEHAHGHPGAPKSRSQRTGKGKGRPDIPAALGTSQIPDAIPNAAGRIPNRRGNIRKLAPPRPFPTVLPSVSASGPKSAHKEGKNLICITRHTTLAAYLSRCKKLLVEDGYQTLHLHAMGAAIPHLLTLSVSLRSILPFAREEVKLEVRTGTIEVMDEIIPEDEDEDMSLRARGKGSVSVIVQIGDGEALPVVAQRTRVARQSQDKGKKRAVVIVQEQDQEDDEMA